MIVAFVLVGAVMTAKAADCSMGNMTLKQGMKGAEVTCLQTALNVSPATGYFGNMTLAAVKAFQANKGLVTDGKVGNATKAAIVAGGVVVPPTQALCPNGMTLASNCTTLPGSTPSEALCPNGMTLASNCTTLPGNTHPVTNGVGTVDSYSLISSLSNEEVGEGMSDVKVYGLEVEAGEGSDLTLTAAKLVFNEGTAASNFRDYADEVSVWLGSTKVGTVDSDKFTDDNNWTYTVALSNAKILAGAKGQLYVAITGISNLDSNDATDTWTLDITSVRWTDGVGAMVSEDPSTGTRTFSFESSAVAANTEFKISADDENVNDAHVIDVHATDDTNNVSVLSFKVKIEGTSDVMLKDLPVNFDVTGAANVDDMVNGLTLFMNGSEVSTSNMSTDCVEAGGSCSGVGADETYVFHDIDTKLEGGKTYNFLVKADFVSIADALDAGDTLAANFGETQTDLSNFDAEDSTGTNLVDADKTGTVTGSASEVRDVGFNAKLVGTPTAVISHTGDIVGSGAGDDDQATFTITFDVTAFGGDIYLDGTSPSLTGAGAITDLSLVTTGTVALTSAVLTSPSGATMTGTINADSRFLVEEGQTERFMITVISTVSADGLTHLKLDDIVYALTDVTGTTSYTFNLDDFKTADIYMNAN